MDPPRGMAHLLGFLALAAFVGLAWAAWELGNWLAERVGWGRLA